MQMIFSRMQFHVDFFAKCAKTGAKKALAQSEENFLKEYFNK